jgi:hypothetical protein
LAPKVQGCDFYFYFYFYFFFLWIRVAFLFTCFDTSSYFSPFCKVLERQEWGLIGMCKTRRDCPVPRGPIIVSCFKMVGACPFQWLFSPEKARPGTHVECICYSFIFMFFKSIFKLKNIKYFLIIFIF